MDALDTVECVCVCACVSEWLLWNQAVCVSVYLYADGCFSHKRVCVCGWYVDALDAEGCVCVCLCE